MRQWTHFIISLNQTFTFNCKCKRVSPLNSLLHLPCMAPFYASSHNAVILLYHFLILLHFVLYILALLCLLKNCLKFHLHLKRRLDFENVPVAKRQKIIITRCCMKSIELIICTKGIIIQYCSFFISVLLNR